MAENREAREMESHEATKRKVHWKAPETLPSPNPEQGYSFRWIRVSSQGEVDAGNVSSKLREGWVPCKAKDHPEIQIVAIEQSRFKDNVVIGGLMLCKAVNEMVSERSEHYENVTDSQMRSVDNNLMRESDARMPLFNERESKVTFGKGN
jgi:hypothetical protein